MPQTCTICKSPDRAAIEASLVAGTSLRNIAKQFSVGAFSVQRHKDCMKPALQDAIVIQDRQAAFSALDEMAWMRTQAKAIYADVWTDAQAKDHRIALQSLGELRKQLELYSELSGDASQETETQDGLLIPFDRISARTRMEIRRLLAAEEDERNKAEGKVS